MSAPAPTFADIQKLLFTLADANDENIRDGIYGRHNPTGGFSWESQDELLKSVVISRPDKDRAFVADRDYRSLTDAQIKDTMENGEVTCWMVYMLVIKKMPRLKPGTNRRYATDDEIDMIIAWLRTLPYPRT